MAGLTHHPNEDIWEWRRVHFGEQGIDHGLQLARDIQVSRLHG